MRDIFISYKNDGEGNNFAARLYTDLTLRGYSVYYNANEQHAGDFPERLRVAVENCKDFLLIVSKTCLDQLIQNEDVDWIREEILIAHSSRKNIIPLLMPGVTMPKNNNIMPESLRFLPNQDAISMPEKYDCSPLDHLLSWIQSKAEETDYYKDAFNLNSDYAIQDEFEKLKVKSHGGDLAATYELATMYYYGITSNSGLSVRDYKNAFDLYMKVYESNSEYSCHAANMIGRMYQDGVAGCGEQSHEKAYAYHMAAASQSRESMQTLAFMRRIGRGCEFDYFETETLYNSFIQQGNDIAKNDLASFYKSYGRFQEAIDMYQSMEIIPPMAEYEMGMIYKSGMLSNPIKPDYFRANYHFQNAINSERPYALAARELGHMYFNGSKEFRVDFKKAKHYFEIGANLGDAGCHYMLGFMYEFGILKKDLLLSEKHFLSADANGDLNAAHHLAMIYQQPELKNYQKAFTFAKKSAEKGKPEGEYIFATLLYIGRGCMPDLFEAQKYYRKAFEHGYFPAKIMLEKFQ